MSQLETQLKASVIWQDLRGQESATLAAIIKAAQQELQNRKDQLRKDAVELQKRRKVLQKQAAELSRAGYRVAPRAERKDKGSRRSKLPSLKLLEREVADGVAHLKAIIVDEQLDSQLSIDELNALDKAADDAECAVADARDDYERQNAARGNEP